MCQAAAQNFAALAALRILSGAFEAIADPAFMLITSMYYTREEQPSRIAAWYIWNGVGVAGGGLIGESRTRGRNHQSSMLIKLQVTASATSKAPSLHGGMNS